MDCSPLGSYVHGILQARILDWVAIPFSRGSSRPRDWTLVSCTAGTFFTVWATREAWDCLHHSGKHTQKLLSRIFKYVRRWGQDSKKGRWRRQGARQKLCLLLDLKTSEHALRCSRLPTTSPVCGMGLSAFWSSPFVCVSFAFPVPSAKWMWNRHAINPSSLLSQETKAHILHGVRETACCQEAG